MARIRSIKPEFWRDRKLARRVSRDARLLYVALWNQADEHGRCDGDPRLIKGQCFPYDDDLDLADIERLLSDLDGAGRLQRYEVDGDPYLFLPKLGKHQRLEPAKVPSRLPEPPSTRNPHPDDDPSGSRADESAPDADESALLYVAGSMEHVAGSVGDAHTQDLAMPDTDPTTRLIVAHNRAAGERLTPSQLAPVRVAIARLVGEGVTENDIAAGLARMRERGLSARMLPELVVEATHIRPSTTDQRVATGLALVEKYREAEGR